MRSARAMALAGLVATLELDEDRAVADGLQETDELGPFNRKRLGLGVFPIENRGNAIGFAETT